MAQTQTGHDGQNWHPGRSPYHSLIGSCGRQSTSPAIAAPSPNPICWTVGTDEDLALSTMRWARASIDLYPRRAER